MKELIGQTVLSMWVNEDQHLLKFTTATGGFIYQAEGDCCSESWFADIIFGNYYNDRKFSFYVESVEDIEIPDFVCSMANKDNRGRQEYERVYGYKIVTDKGEHEIIYRNSSNGYYGGNCQLLVGGSVWCEDLLKSAIFTQITEDWSA